MPSKIVILQKFKQLSIQFLDELIGQFPSETDLVIARVMVTDQLPVNEIMNEFMKRILPHEQHVKDRNDKFFLEELSLFSDLKTNDETVIKFKKLWTSDNLGDDDKDAIWDWFDVFMKVMKAYKNAT